MHAGTWKRMGALLFALSLAVVGCQGDKGPQGAQGAQGDQGPQGDPGGPGPAGENAFFTDVESCGGCHGGSLVSKHAQNDQLNVEVAVPAGAVAVVDNTASGGTIDVTVTFSVTVNGVARFDFNRSASAARNHNEDAWWVYDDVQQAGVRTKIPIGSWTLATFQNGNVVVTIPGFGTPAPGTAFMFNVMNPAGLTATAVAYYQGRAHDVVSDDACKSCHGNLVWRDAAHDVTYPQGVGPCIVCHARVGSADPRLPGAGSGLMGIVHGIHNSKNMPDEQYTFTWTNGNQFNFSIGFPGYMNNCSTCHDSTARLDAVKDAPVAYGLCISCHDSMLGFPRIAAATTGALNTHKTYTAATVCGGCHDAMPGLSTVSEMHNGLVTERNGLIWDGEDQSVVEGKRLLLSIDSITPSGANLVVEWSATLDGAPVDPCNTDFALGPVFMDVNAADAATGLSTSNMSLLQAYAQANDWVNAGAGTSPGQPPSAPTLRMTDFTGTDGKLQAANTTCAGDVATSTIAAATTTATKGVIGLQGKPQIRFDPALGTDREIIQLRSKSPTVEFDVATGAAPAAAELRRQIVSIDKCNTCHLGSMYQHGGNRVDSTDLCVMCHNPASSEKNNRVTMGVDPTEAYDGKAGETYDLRTMVHAIHSAGETGQPLVYYRSNGIYFFGSKDALAKIAGIWPPTQDALGNVPAADKVVCSDGRVFYRVHGAGTSGTKPVAPDGAGCVEGTTAPNSTDGTWRVHTFVEVHYPRPLSECAACHVSDSAKRLPNPTRAVAVTFDAGAAPWNNLLDDVLIGAGAASCMSCHQSGDPTIQFDLRIHAYGQGWVPTTFEGGRQTIIDAATLP